MINRGPLLLLYLHSNKRHTISLSFLAVLIFETVAADRTQCKWRKLVRAARGVIEAPLSYSSIKYSSIDTLCELDFLKHV